MSQKCEKCGAEISEFDFGVADYAKDPLQLQCPYCKTQLENWQAELLRDDFEEETVICPECDACVRMDEFLNIPDEPDDWRCPKCDARFGDDDQKKIAEYQPYSCAEEMEQDMLEMMFPDGQDEDEEE